MLLITKKTHPEKGCVFLLLEAVADHKADEGFHDWPFHNKNGQSVAHFYTPIYNGSVISSKMRSLSGQQVSKSLAAMNISLRNPVHTG